MKKTRFMILLSILIPMLSLAEGFSEKALVGKWEFMHYAEVNTPQKTNKIGYLMDFKANGEVVTLKSSGNITEHYEVKNNMILYKGKYGEQKWKIVVFNVQKGFVVNQMGTLMTFEKRD